MHQDISVSLYYMWANIMPNTVNALQSQQGGIFGLFGGAGQSNTGHNIV